MKYIAIEHCAAWCQTVCQL